MVIPTGQRVSFPKGAGVLTAGRPSRCSRSPIPRTSHVTYGLEKMALKRTCWPSCARKSTKTCPKWMDRRSTILCKSITLVTHHPDTVYTICNRAGKNSMRIPMGWTNEVRCLRQSWLIASPRLRWSHTPFVVIPKGKSMVSSSY